MTTPRIKPDRISGLYAVTPDATDTDKLCIMVEAALRGGAALIQYRNKTADSTLRIAQARALLALCRQHGVPLIINDHIELCLAIDADGVHLGADDSARTSLREAKASIGNDKILGASCYNRIELALDAKSQGADYVAFGACFDSATKPAAVRAPLALLAQAREQVGLPIVAIGGITPDNAAQAIGAGAGAIAVIGAVFAAPDVQHAAQQFSHLFTYIHNDTQPATI